MGKKEVRGTRIRETREDRVFNAINMVFWIAVLFLVLYPLWLIVIASVSDPDAVLAWQPGDLVTFESSHIAVVSNLRNIWGRPYIIQHGKDPAAEEDRLVASDGMEISGHYRWPVTE